MDGSLPIGGWQAHVPLADEEHCRALFESAQDAILVLREGRCVECNPAALRVYGCAREQIIGQTPVRFSPVTQSDGGSSAQKAADKIAAALGGQPQTFEWRNCRLDGSEFDAEVSLNRFDARGERLLLAVVRDITDRKRAEEALRASEQRWRSLTEMIDVGVVVHDAQTRVIASNAAAQAMLGMTAQEMIGKTAVDSAWHLIAEDGTRMPVADYPVSRAVATGREVRNQTIGMVLPRGQTLWAIVNADPVYDPDGTLREVFVAFMDVTDRKLAEQATLASKQMLQMVLDTIPVRVFWKDRESRYLGCNRLFAADMGLASVEEIVGKDDLQMIFKEADLYRRDDHEVIESGVPRLNYEEPQTSPDGRRTWLRTSKIPLRDTAGAIRGVLGVYEDITDRKRSEQELKALADELRRSNRDLEQFAYVASHDLQEPLRMVSGYVELLEKRCKADLGPEAMRYIKFAIDGTRRMQRLIGDLLDYSRVREGEKRLRPVAMQAAFDRATADLATAIAEAGATITHDSLPVVWGDETQLAQLLLNLLGNAIKFRGERPPRIHMGARRRDEDWLFWVSDNGIGIDHAQFERIFQVFQRLHTRDKYPGSGIGLPLCKRIVEGRGGTMWVESDVGQGSTFYFTIPHPGGHEQGSNQ